MRIKTNSGYKKELDKIFSLYVRAKYANVFGSVKCYTCGKSFHWRTIQNGHFVQRAILVTRWDENNCRPQCVGCNIFGRGKIHIFSEKLLKELGKEKYLKLVSQNKTNIMGSPPDVKKLLIKYKKKLDKELNKKGLEI